MQQKRVKRRKRWGAIWRNWRAAWAPACYEILPLAVLVVREIKKMKFLFRLEIRIYRHILPLRH